MSGLSRYQRQMILPELGAEGQNRLSEARLLVVGAGALGSAALQYLVGAGVGVVGIVDFDEVEETNLPRQILYATADINKPKVMAAAERLAAMNPDVDIVTHFMRFNTSNALDIIEKYDLVVECSDNFNTKYLVNDACVIQGKPCVIGAAIGFSGQLSVYNYQNGPTFRCLLPNPPDPITMPTCANAGVMGMIPGIIGNMQALEAIKIITGVGEVLSGRLLHFDGLTSGFVEIPIEPVANNKSITALTEYEYSCPDALIQQHTVEPQDFSRVLEQEGPFEVIAISDNHEFLCLHQHKWKAIPLYKLPDTMKDIPDSQKVMLVCEAGVLNIEALKYLLVKQDAHQAFALKYGLEAVRFLSKK